MAALSLSDMAALMGASSSVAVRFLRPGDAIRHGGLRYRVEVVSSERASNGDVRVAVLDNADRGVLLHLAPAAMVELLP